MRRREPLSPAVQIPARLLRWDPEDWPEAEVPEVAFWEAWDAFHAEHPDADTPVVVYGPDVPFDRENKDGSW
ncbi:MAG: hypothetical protein ACTHQ3_08605 [Motilibacteraceae bacterium]